MRHPLNVPAEDAPAIFADPAAREVQTMLDRLAPTDATLLIIGETGTGKEMAARYVHARSKRRSKPFLAVNCGALSDTLAEAELFGHEKGAFTGAARAQHGWFEAASGGTLLLDEVGDLPLQLQVKLLRVLQERVVTRLGSRAAVPIDVRVIAATNVDLHHAIAQKRFREDLYFRLNVATVMLPPLRERKAGLAVLVQHFLKKYGDRLGRPTIQVSAEAMRRLARYAWPGNIRELENVIHNAILLAGTEVIESGDLQIAPVRQGEAAVASGPGSLEAMLREAVDRAIEDKEPALLDRVTRTAVQAAYDAVGANQVRAAASLGITRNALRTQLSHLGIIPPRRHIEAAQGSTRPRHREVHIGFQKFGLLNILKTHGGLEERLVAQGFTVRWTGFPAGPQLLDALAAGQIDFGTTGEVPPIFAQSAGAAILYVAYEPAAPGSVAVVVPRASQIRNITDMRGKRLRFNKGSNVHYLVIRGLEAHGMSLQDVKIIYAPPDERMVLPSGGTDSWALWDPLLTTAQLGKQVRVLFDGTGLVANHTFHIAARAFAATHPRLIEILIDELRAIGRYVTGDVTAAAQALSGRIGIDVPTLQVAFKRLTHGAKPMDQTVIWEQQKIADRLYALGIIPQPIAIRDAVGWVETVAKATTVA